MMQESLDLFRAAGDEHGVARALTTLVIRDAMTENWEGAIPRLEESVAIWRGLGDRLQLAFDLVWLAFVYGRARRWRAATTAALEAVDIFREAGNPTGIALVFRDLSFICVWKGRAEDALRFAGAAESLRERIGGGPPQGFGGMLEGDPAAEARQQLSDEVAQRSWDEGLGMDVEQVVGLAREMLAG